MKVTIEFPLDGVKDAKNYFFYGKRAGDKIVDIRKVSFKKENVILEVDLSLNFHYFVEDYTLNYLVEEKKLELILQDSNIEVLKKAAKRAPEVLRSFLEDLAEDVDEILR
jgi:hypothetical protein